MFRKTRLHIFTLIMVVATLIITLMLSVIYFANSKNSFERSISLLESYVNEPENNFRPNEKIPPDRPEFQKGMKDKHNKMFKLSTFYSVFYDENGEVAKVNCNDGNLYSEQEILEIANSIVKKNAAQGKYNNMPFLVRNVRNGTVVALIDNTMEDDNFYRLFKNLLIVGISAWVLILALSWFFSKKIVQPLEQNDIKQKQFISDAGHELKTPISVISANADILAMELGENKWLSNIQYENERMGNLVKQLLELVRAENKTQDKEKIDFSRLVSGGALPFESVAFEKGLVLECDIDDGIFVNGNKNQLSQLISIFIDNAIDHSSNGKEVLVKLHSSKNNAVLSVVNSGEAIPNDIKERLFERFYRTDEARTEEDGHYGLGLAIAKAVATSHQGKIELNCSNGLIEFKFIISKI